MAQNNDVPQFYLFDKQKTEFSTKYCQVQHSYNNKEPSQK